MKLSVKWLAGLAVLALAVVAVVGSTPRGQAATGVIYVANTGQLLTTEPGQTVLDDGFATTSTLWATYAADVSNGEALRLINSGTDSAGNTAGDAQDADLLKIIIIDPVFDLSTTVIDGVGAQTLDLTAPFNSTVITITNPGPSPIASAASAIKIYVDNDDDGVVDVGDTQIAGPGTTALNLQATVLTVNALGSAINVQSEVSTGGTPDIIVEYQTSAVNTIQDGVDPDGAGTVFTGLANVKVKSDVDTTGQSLWLEETSRSSGRFEGFVRLTDQDGDGGGLTDGLAEADATGPASTQAAVLRVASGPVTIAFTDSGGVQRTASVLIDTSAPVNSITAPTTGSASQNRQPLFSGTVNESGSGLDVSMIDLVIHEAAEAANTNDIPVIAANGTNTGTPQGLTTTGAFDGDFSFSFTLTPDPLPSGLGTGVLPDHLVDYQLRSADLAGNLGFSDSDGDSTADDGDVTGGVTLPGASGAFDAHVVKIDSVAPALLGPLTTPPALAGDHKTGVHLNASNAEEADGNSLRLTFNDSIQGAEPGDFTVTFPSNGSSHIPTAVQVKGTQVYLTLAVAIPANERPRVDLQGSISDAAGNATANGSTNVADGIAPTLTVTLSGGTGTGTGSESASALTTDKMVITVTSNEPLQQPPQVRVHVLNNGTPQASPTALSFGTNTWVATYSATGTTGDRAVVVSANDSAAAGTTPSNANNAETEGAVGTKSFRLDEELQAPTVTPADGGTTSQIRPFLVVDFGDGGETATVVIDEITLDGVNVTTSLVASSDNKRFFVLPSSDLTVGEHTLSIPVTKARDAAGNKNAAVITTTFEVIDRPTFDVPVFAGWNAVSFPSDPIDPDINSVFTNAGHDAVLGFDPSVPGMYVIATRDSVSGELTTTTENGLNSVRSTQAYWLHSNNFEDVEVLLVGETLPDSGSIPSIPQIQTVLGFNAVPVIDATRKQTTGAGGLTHNLMRTPPTGPQVAVTVDDYLGAVTYGRVYRWDPETLTFVSLDGDTIVDIGTVLFVEVVGTATPIFP